MRVWEREPGPIVGWGDHVSRIPPEEASETELSARDGHRIKRTWAVRFHARHFVVMTQLDREESDRSEAALFALGVPGRAGGWLRLPWSLPWAAAADEKLGLFFLAGTVEGGKIAGAKSERLMVEMGCLMDVGNRAV